MKKLLTIPMFFLLIPSMIAYAGSSRGSSRSYSSPSRSYSRPAYSAPIRSYTAPKPVNNTVSKPVAKPVVKQDVKPVVAPVKKPVVVPTKTATKEAVPTQTTKTVTSYVHTNTYVPVQQQSSWLTFANIGTGYLLWDKFFGDKPQPQVINNTYVATATKAN